MNLPLPGEDEPLVMSDLPVPEGRWWHSVVAMLLFVAIVAACILAVFWFD